MTIEKKDQILKDLEEEIAVRKKTFKRTSQLQNSVTIAISVTGFLTSAAAAEINQNLIIFHPGALVAYGGFTTLGGAILLILNSKSSSPAFKHTVKIAMEAIRDYVKYRDLKPKKAAKLLTQAKTRPDEVLSELQQSSKA